MSIIDIPKGKHTLSFTSEMTVKIIDWMASDLSVTRSAQVSVKGENNPNTDTPKLINYLLSARHGSPFEHSVFTFYVEAPIFVFREFHRHRMASYNEWSARYSEMRPKFYLPGENRKLVNVSSPARPVFELGTKAQREIMIQSQMKAAETAWDEYQRQLDAGIAREVARAVLPVSIMSQMYVTINARSLMNFLSVRVDGGMDSTFESYPQREIEIVAEALESVFAEAMPITHAAFVANGRVAP